MKHELQFFLLQETQPHIPFFFSKRGDEADTGRRDTVFICGFLKAMEEAERPLESS